MVQTDSIETALQSVYLTTKQEFALPVGSCSSNMQQSGGEGAVAIPSTRQIQRTGMPQDRSLDCPAAPWTIAG
jgi:hypothetical protein